MGFGGPVRRVIPIGRCHCEDYMKYLRACYIGPSIQLALSQ